MDILMISGSRNPEGQTAQAADALLRGVADAGGQCERFFLPQMRIERCRQCEDNGWGICRTEGQCVIEDDFAMLVDKLRAADAAVFANPVYFGDLSESLRAFFDRLRRICIHEEGRQGIEDKLAIGICVAGGRGLGAPACGLSIEKAMLNARLDAADVVLVRRQNGAIKQETLEITGRRLSDYVPADK
jgi:multimeric flavodoxin WrbA